MTMTTTAPAGFVSTASRAISVAAIPGDGIGPEVIREAVKVLAETIPTVQITSYDLGSARWHKTGEVLPDSVLAELRDHDAILLGAVGHPSVSSGVLERELLLRLRFELDLHVNLRPIRLFDGVKSPLRGDHEIDMLVVREGTEGPYVGNGGVLRKGTPNEVATETGVNTAFGVERVVRDAFRRAAARPRRHLTLVHKTNVLTYAGSLWRRTVERLAQEYPSVTVAYQHVDAAAMYFVTDPGRFDVIVTDNMFGDILTDLGAAITGGLGLAASASLDLTRANPSMFEPVHGSAPDIAGHGAADPTAAVLSVALMLDHLGFREQAKRVEAAVTFDLATRDDKAPGRTAEIGDRLAALASGRR
jgi:3-isopropylmalate dehydrogenase